MAHPEPSPLSSRFRDPVRISDPDDARVEAYRGIRERDLVGRRGLFVVEGRTVLEAALRAGVALDSVLLLDRRVAGLKDLLQAVAAETPVFEADSPVLDAIAGFPMHRGVLAIARRPAALGLSAMLDALPDPTVEPAPSPVIVLCAVGLANHDNIGAIFRNAAALGASGVVLDETCGDPFYRKALRVASGAMLLVPHVHGGAAASIVATLAARGYETLSLSPSGTMEIAELTPSRRMALIVGSEGPGLPREILDMTRTVRIEMARGRDSLNVATAAAIALDRMRRRG